MYVFLCCLIVVMMLAVMLAAGTSIAGLVADSGGWRGSIYLGGTDTGLSPVKCRGLGF